MSWSPFWSYWNTHMSWIASSAAFSGSSGVSPESVSPSAREGMSLTSGLPTGTGVPACSLSGTSIVAARSPGRASDEPGLSMSSVQEARAMVAVAIMAMSLGLFIDAVIE